MLFRVHSGLATGEKDFFELNPGAEAIEEIRRCTSRQAFFVCLVADRDWDSPFRTLDEETRRTRAAKTAGWGMEGDRPDKNARNLIAGKIDDVELAIKWYRENQYDEEREMLDAIDAQIKDCIRLMKMDKEAACKVTTTKTNKKTGEIEKTEFTDMKQVAALTKDTLGFGAKLAQLRSDKIQLSKSIQTFSVSDKVTTYTSHDIPDESIAPSKEGGRSTIDIFMSQKNKQD